MYTQLHLLGLSRTALVVSALAAMLLAANGIAPTAV